MSHKIKRVAFYLIASGLLLSALINLFTLYQVGLEQGQVRGLEQWAEARRSDFALHGRPVVSP